MILGRSTSVLVAVVVALEKGFVEGKDGFELDAECYLVGWVDHVGGCSYISVGVLGPCVD